MKTAALKQVQYDPSVFLDVENVDEAVSVILTPEDGLTSKQRWKNETPYLMDIIKGHIAAQSVVLDYGCGIGRLSKPLIQMMQCHVIGVDISPNMRALAESCVDSNNFCALSPSMFANIFKEEFFDAALAVWALQHVLDLGLEMRRIRRTLKTGATFFVVNNKQRVLPSNDGRWIDDQLDVRKLIAEAGFVETACGALAGADIAPGALASNTFWAMYRKA